MLSFILPTRNRPERLARTLARLGSLSLGPGGEAQAEVIVADNASTPAAGAPGGGTEGTLENGVPVRVVRLEKNIGAAARNHAAHASDPRAQWLVMLDDDSYPLSTGLVGALRDADAHTAAVQAEVVLAASRGSPNGAGRCADGTGTEAVGDLGRTGACGAGQSGQERDAVGGRVRESGGLPEVFVGCGVAIRRGVFLSLGGYDPAFDYYAEEYDLAARILVAGGRVTLDRRFVVEHEKAAANRSMNRILRRLVRNNVYVALRYTPRGLVGGDVWRNVSRYARIALREGAVGGYAMGLADLVRTGWKQKRAEMTLGVYERFIGLAAARSALGAAWLRERFTRAVLIGEGKNGHVVRRALDELGVGVTASVGPRDAMVRELPPGVPAVVGTLSPGPMLDALEAARDWSPGARVLAAWDVADARATKIDGAGEEMGCAQDAPRGEDQRGRAA